MGYIVRCVCDKVCKYGLSKSAPKGAIKSYAQQRYACETKEASQPFCPESVLPEASVNRSGTMIGISRLRSSFTSSMAKALLWHLRHQK
jgi:hypothetical protein